MILMLHQMHFTLLALGFLCILILEWALYFSYSLCGSFNTKTAIPLVLTALNSILLFWLMFSVILYIIALFF